MTQILESSLTVHNGCNGYYLYGMSVKTGKDTFLACLGDGAGIEPGEAEIVSTWGHPTELAEALDFQLYNEKHYAMEIDASDYYDLLHSNPN